MPKHFDQVLNMRAAATKLLPCLLTDEEKEDCVRTFRKKFKEIHNSLCGFYFSETEQDT
jgi:hypothetical protein